MKFLWVIFIATVCVSALAAGSQPDRCADVLRGGVFNEHMVNLKSENSEAYRKWECTATFSTHDEAINAGLSVGLQLFGVPLQVGGAWQTGQQDQWKQNHCTSDERRADSSNMYFEYVRTADPNILQAWTRCMANNEQSGSAIQCSIQKPGNGTLLFESRWKRTAGEDPATAAPRISFYAAYDANCDRTWIKGDQLPETLTTFVCKPPPFKEAVFNLETNRGACRETDELITSSIDIDGQVELQDLRNYSADRITFKDGSVLVTNGNKLSLRAIEIKVEGTAKIVSFRSRTPRPAGDPGRSAGAIIIAAERMVGSPLRIENFGEDGVKGAMGGQGPQGGAGRQGTQRDWDFGGCHGGSNGTQGGAGGQGQAGGVGGNGGAGGSVFYDVKFGIGKPPLQTLDILTTRNTRTFQKAQPLRLVDCQGPCGGLPGSAGDGGPGGPGGPGGQGAPGTSKCGGTDAGLPGPNGAPGSPGTEGATGPAGQIEDIGPSPTGTIVSKNKDAGRKTPGRTASPANKQQLK